MRILHLRSGKLLWGGLVALVAIAGAVTAGIFLWPAHWHSGEAQTVVHPYVEPTSQLKRDGQTIVISSEVVHALGLQTVAAKQADKPRALPALSGTLAIDNGRLARIPPRFAGEVVGLGTADGKEAIKVLPADGSKGRFLRFGDRVQEGQLLVVLWSKDLGEKKSEYVDSLVRLHYDTAYLAKLEGLLKDGATAAQNVEDQRAKVLADMVAFQRAERTLQSWKLPEKDFDTLRKEAETLEKDLTKVHSRDHKGWARFEIRAPHDGVILEMNAALGTVVNDTSADLFKIADTSRLAVWAYLYEDDLPLMTRMLKQGPVQCSIQLPSQPGVKLVGTLEHVGEIIDPNQHTALVKGAVDNLNGDLKAGQYVTCKVELPPLPEEIEIPTTALVEDGRESIVFVQPNPNEMKFERRKVTVSRRFHDVVYLQQSLQPGELVVTSGALLLNDAMNE